MKFSNSGLASIAGICKSFVVVLLTVLTLTAQAAENKPPTIELLESGRNSKETELFEVRVTDDDQVSEVILHYKFNPTADFRSESMPLTSRDIYSRSLTDIESNSESVYFYITASDTFDFLAHKGFSFDPLERSLAGQKSSPDGPAPSNPGSGSKWKWIGGGALVVILAALCCSTPEPDPPESGPEESGKTFTLIPPTLDP